MTLGPTEDPNPPHPGLVLVYTHPDRTLLGNPFSPFPRIDPRPIANFYGEVYTAVGHFVPGRPALQLACAQGIGGQQIIRLFEYTATSDTNSYSLIGQFIAFDPAARLLNEGGGIILHSRDFDRDGIDELVLGPTRASAQPQLQIAAIDILDASDQAILHVPRQIFPAFDESLRSTENQVVYTVGDLDGDGGSEILTVPIPVVEADRFASFPILVWKVRPQPHGAFDVSLWGKFSAPRNDTGEDPIQSVRLACGNLDLDAGDEILCMITRAGEPLQSIHVFEPIFSEEGNPERLELFYTMDRSSDSVSPLGWLEGQFLTE